MIDYIMERALTGEKDRIAFKIPDPLRHGLFIFFSNSRTNFFRVQISHPRRPRTTGEKSQNHHINGHIQQIALETGNDFETVKTYVKKQAVSMGYPFDSFQGDIIPWSERRIDRQQAAILIEACHRLAAELGIFLTEE